MNLAKSLLAALVFWAACFSSCAHLLVRPNGTVDGQERAMEIVWNEVYGRTDKPPAIRWITEFNCDSDVNGKPGFLIWTPEGHVCREGYTVVPFQVEVALRNGDRFSDTTLAHESCHAMQMREGVFDPFHKTSCFTPGGLTDQANAKLIVEGM